jgi:flagellar assembly protein FliH
VTTEYFKPPEFGKPDEEEDKNGAAEVHDFASHPNVAEQVTVAETFELEDVEEKKKIKRRKKIDYSQFNSSEFNEVDTLLTNVEDYTQKIREDAERYVHQVREEVDLLKSEIELELANALIKRLNAERISQDMIKAAEESRSEVQKQAWEEGFTAGFAEGHQVFKSQNEEVTGHVMTLLNELQGLRLGIFQEYENQIVKLSTLIAKKIIHNELRTEKEFVLQMIKDSMSHFEGMGSVHIKVNPIEYDMILTHQEALRSFLDEEQIIKVRSEAGIPSASAVIESDFSKVDLDMQKQMAEIEGRLQDCSDDRKILFRPKGK